ncbi:MAG: pantetheine-phosphate adenylyltransferase [Peptococcaceae bacterium]|jgi:pantetheine-phosphate adenylyltransferase|nr:pantetheine-phosphate adenylyltransferase [Peptococcaceae bacterium]
MRLAIYPGTFDPITLGHLDIIERAAGLFDRLVVSVSLSSPKTPLFSMEERLAMLGEVLVAYPNTSADSFTGLTVKYAQKSGAQALIRGLRAISDFENEFMMALTNKKLVPSVETIFLMTRAEFSFISSSAVKEVAFYGGYVCDMVPPAVEKMLRSKYGGPKG